MKKRVLNSNLILAITSIVSAVIAMCAETYWHLNETIHQNINYQTKYILEIAYFIILIPIVYASVLLIKKKKEEKSKV